MNEITFYTDKMIFLAIIFIFLAIGSARFVQKLFQ